ncbi:hypothetical protein J6590_058945 [Homalodisca vitripennis]|nr:hypothetical protein J6590_058945 [Homalodisca vitripennis]
METGQSIEWRLSCIPLGSGKGRCIAGSASSFVCSNLTLGWQREKGDCVVRMTERLLMLFAFGPPSGTFPPYG